MQNHWAFLVLLWKGTVSPARNKGAHPLFLLEIIPLPHITSDSGSSPLSFEGIN